MTDLEITKLCAEAMGMRSFQWFPSGDYPDQNGTYEISGNEIMRLEGNPLGGYNRYAYDPLHDDAQAMALAKRFHIDTSSFLNLDGRWVWQCRHDKDVAWTDPHHDLNRVVCECVAEMQKDKP